ncbi:hypothetical protein Goshw_000410, partial [Gossypium schwendimanii]|nr:hypothetical protein [Gossypium schwendimanii]
YPQASDEHVPLSYHNVAASALSTGLLVNTNLEVSVPDAYRPPPAPMPFDAVVEPPQTPQTPSVIQGIHNSKSNETLQTTNVNSSQGTVAVNTQETSIKSENTKEDCEAQSNTDIESLKGLEVGISKPVKSIVSTKEEEEDVCPTCLE